MTSVHGGLVRVRVHGPKGRADLAVPVATPLTDLVPVLLRHTDDDLASAEPGLAGDWVLQRVGGPPLDPDGTPETLDWVEGEQFYLRPADAAMPALDFDDIADGMATAVAKQRDRWRPEFSRVLLLGVAAAAVLTALFVLRVPGAPVGALWMSAVLAVGCAGMTVLAARVRVDRALVALLGVAAESFAWQAGVLVADAPGLGPVPSPAGAVWAGGAVAVVGGLLLGARAVLAPEVPLLPFSVAVLGGVGLVVPSALHAFTGASGTKAIAITATVFLAAMTAAPRVVLRLARLHGPQLPRSTEDLQLDIEPLPAAQVVGRTAFADQCLSTLAVVTALVHAVSAVLLLDEADWAQTTLVALFAALLALRARVHLTVAQRVAPAAASVSGSALLLLALTRDIGPGWRWVPLVALAIITVLAVTGALRPATRRPRPVWAHLASILESAAALAVVPILLQVLGVYAWARGLAG
ncbi:MAG: type VII secretion integral membrane protein EccD [Kibdelosporangium sp.]